MSNRECLLGGLIKSVVYLTLFNDQFRGLGRSEPLARLTVINSLLGVYHSVIHDCWCKAIESTEYMVAVDSTMTIYNVQTLV